MVKNNLPERAEPGQKNALDWLSLKIIECAVKPMDKETAQDIAVYQAAYGALSRLGQKNARGDKRGLVTAEERAETHISLKNAEEWCEGMINADGTTGPHWTLDKTKQIQAQRKISGSPISFYAAINATYSDLCEFFKKYGISTMDAYVDFVKSFWLNDVDAVDDKVGAYYDHIVKGPSTV